eukprot:1157356-Pelagomonas_calceolata.AAC.2
MDSRCDKRCKPPTRQILQIWAPPAYTPQQVLAMKQRHDQARQQAALLTDQDKEWLALPPIPDGMGLSLKRYRWTQNMSHIEVHIKLPPKVSPSQETISIWLASLILRINWQEKVSLPNTVGDHEPI